VPITIVPLSDQGPGAEPKSPKSASAISSMAGNLIRVGYICLADIEDPSQLCGEMIKLVRSDGLVDDVELLEVLPGQDKARCKDRQGRVLVKKDKYCFCIPLGLMQLAKNAREQEGQRARDDKAAPAAATADVVENVILKVRDWEVCFDERGKKFYFNTRTEESSWRKPPELADLDV
jgi:hypothetical protein